MKYTSIGSFCIPRTFQLRQFESCIRFDVLRIWLHQAYCVASVRHSPSGDFRYLLKLSDNVFSQVVPYHCTSRHGYQTSHAQAWRIYHLMLAPSLPIYGPTITLCRRSAPHQIIDWVINLISHIKQRYLSTHIVFTWTWKLFGFPVSSRSSRHRLHCCKSIKSDIMIINLMNIVERPRRTTFS